MTLRHFAGFCVGIFVSVPAFAEAPRTIIVMDGSGSMWGQIDGRPKLEIARETVTEVLGTIPADREIGLMAYGHRERGNCADIELIVPPAPGTGADIAARVNEMRFQGKTPLSEAVRQAAGVLRSGEEAATVVLVTDGLETCEANPCALGRELEAAGLNFTAHVIGFGLTEEEGAQVACLATETGGRYLQASDAGALADALAQTVAAPAPVPGPAPAPADPTPTALLTAPATAPQGSRILVGWEGPRSTYDYIRVFDASGEWQAEVAVGEQNPLELQLPWLTGDFTLAYVLETDVISEQVPITLTPAPVSITAPATAQVGQDVTITWVGPDAFLDNIQLWNDDTGDRWGYGYVEGKVDMVWTMPDEPGTYRFAYKFRDREEIHNTPITVTLDRTDAAPETAPQTSPALQAVPVTFTGAGTEDFPLSITWSATPVPGQGLPPEAFAMNEGVLGTTTAEFLPGTYDVLGDAGDTVFAGQVTVTATGPNDFFIPVSAALSPAGPDAAPVTVTITGPYMGTFRQWAAIPLPDGAALRSEGEINDAWVVDLMPGQWLITATASGAEGEGLAAVVDIAGPGTVEVGQPTFGAAPFIGITPFHRQCKDTAPCAYSDDISGLRALLLPGWLMQDPYTLTTAAGEGGVVSTLFGTTGMGSDPLAALNPRQWDATLGPCEDTAAGKLCRMADMSGDALAGYRVIAATLRLDGPPPAAAGTPVGIVGPPVNLAPETAANLRKLLFEQP
jgi:Ca-activated chloride channel homolog